MMMVSEQHPILITPADIGYWPIEVRGWFAGLGWLEVDEVRFNREILPDGFVTDERNRKWAKWKHGPHITVIARHGDKWQQQEFTIEETGWHLVKGKE